MRPNPTILHKWYQVFLKRFAAGTGITAILTACLFSGYLVQSTVSQLQKSSVTFSDTQLRNGYVAMSDVQRLILIMQGANGRGMMTPDAAAEFAAAADFLFVRADILRRIEYSGNYVVDVGPAIAAIEQVQELADEAIATDFAELDLRADEIILRAQTARRALITYLDDVRKIQNQLLEKQSIAVLHQRNVIWATLLALSIMGIVATILLRKEIREKQARRAAEERVHHLAFFDPLTGLPNRVQFQDRIAAMREDGERIALLLVDLDGFKEINDAHGHAAGDNVLSHVAVALQDICALNGGFAARVGGDEFAVVFATDDLSRLAELCEAILIAIGQPFRFEGSTLTIAASIGLATNTQIGSEVEMTNDGLARVADFALYASKSNGKHQYTIYDDTLEIQFSERRSMIEDLPGAIADGSMDYYLQPKVNLRTGQFIGFEALARWRRNGEVLPPGAFIATAEENGLIAEIDCCILRNVTRDIAAFNRQHGTAYSISTNFSTLHFRSLSFVKIVKDALASSGLRPDLLTIEITETIEMHDWDEAKQIVSAIRDLGTKVAIDDFGTGFSSLAYLRKTVANEIKIDQSLVQDIETSQTSRFLLEAVLDIACNLELDATVEGIETKEQADILLEMGAKIAQGYYFSHPLPKEVAFASALEKDALLMQRPAS